MECNNCDLCKFSSPSCIPGSGSKKAKVMIINSYAGDEDEAAGEATPEKIVKGQFEELGYDMSKVYYTNAVKCRTPKKYKIKVSEVKKCREHLLKEIKRVKPQYVLMLGAQACQAALDMKISELQGTPYEKDGITYYATYSPRVIFYDASKAPQVTKELRNFLELTKGKNTHHKPKLNSVAITSMEEAKAAIRGYRKKYKSVSYDIETTGLNRYTDYLTLFGWGNDKIQYYVPLKVPYSPLYYKPIAQIKIMKYLIKELDKFKHKIGANIKFDNLFLAEKYGRSPKPTFDVNLASHLLDENTPNGLKQNAIFEFSCPNWDVNTNLKKGTVSSREDYEEFVFYNAYDIYYTHKLYKRFTKKLKKDPALWNIYNTLVMPVSVVYEEIEKEGVYIYQDRFRELEATLRKKQQEAKDKMYNCLPPKVQKKFDRSEINWNSDDQLRKLLYQELKIPVIETTESGKPSTSESVLKRISKHHPLPGLILEYRGVSIQISHFIDGWISRFDKKGRLHPRFRVDGTVTGRTSCVDPNLQQVPRDKAIRSLIGAPPGWTLVESDYSQLELRVAALVSQEPTLIRLFQTGVDIHLHTGQLVTGKQELTYEERKQAKSVNFGFIYGMGWRKFKDYARDSYDVHLTDKEAETFRRKYFEGYNKLPDWHSRQRKIVHFQGEVRSPIGRIRRLPDVFSADKSKVAEAERQSINSPVQGFGSDLCLLSLVEAFNFFDRKVAKCVGTVHDAQLWMVKDEYMNYFCTKLKKIMEKPKALKEVFHFESNVPIVTDVEIGDWGKGVELEEWLEKHKDIEQLDWED